MTPEREKYLAKCSEREILLREMIPTTFTTVIVSIVWAEVTQRGSKTI